MIIELKMDLLNMTPIDLKELRIIVMSTCKVWNVH